MRVRPLPCGRGSCCGRGSSSANACLKPPRTSVIVFPAEENPAGRLGSTPFIEIESRFCVLNCSDTLNLSVVIVTIGGLDAGLFGSVPAAISSRSETPSPSVSPVGPVTMTETELDTTPPCPSLTVTVAVKAPASEYVCETDAPSALAPSPKVQWYASVSPSASAAVALKEIVCAISAGFGTAAAGD